MFSNTTVIEMQFALVQLEAAKKTAATKRLDGLSARVLVRAAQNNFDAWVNFCVKKLDKEMA